MTEGNNSAPSLVRTVERDLTRAVIDRFINLRQATPRQYLISNFHDSDAIDRSFRLGLFTDIGTQTYAPTVLGFEFCADPDALARARKETEIVLRALQKLAANGNLQTNFTAGELAAEAQIISEGPSTSDFKTGIFLASEFPSTFRSYSRKLDECALTGFLIDDRVFKLKDLNHAWDRQVSNRRYFLDQTHSPERRLRFLSNLYRFAGKKQSPAHSNLWYRAATDAGFQHDEIDLLIDDCVAEGVIHRDVKTDNITFSDTGFAQEQQRERASDQVDSKEDGLKTGGTKKRKEIIADLIEETRNFRFCGPSDDPDEQTAVTSGFRYLVIQFKRLVAPILLSQSAQRLEAIDVEIDNLYSAYDAKAELDALLPEIGASLERLDDDGFSQINRSTLIAESRLAELRSLPKTNFDFCKLVRLCEEINSACGSQCYYATAMLIRGLLDHVPPIFGFKTFVEVSNNYAGGGRSFRDTVQHLDQASRKVADAHLHMPIRSSETLPTQQQVNCSQQLDVLLSEIIRVSR